MLVRTGHVGTGIEGLRFLLGPGSADLNHFYHECTFYSCNEPAVDGRRRAASNHVGVVRPLPAAPQQQQLLEGRARYRQVAAVAACSLHVARRSSDARLTAKTSQLTPSFCVAHVPSDPSTRMGPVHTLVHTSPA